MVELKSLSPNKRRYEFRGRSKTGRTQNFPRALTNVFNTRPQFHSIHLKIYSYYFRVPGYKSIPPSNTVSLRLVYAAHSWDEYEVHSFIASCKKLEILEITAMRNEGGFSFLHTSGQRFPPSRSYACVNTTSVTLRPLYGISGISLASKV
jgi:hypothetical protein